MPSSDARDGAASDLASSPVNREPEGPFGPSHRHADVAINSAAGDRHIADNPTLIERSHLMTERDNPTIVLVHGGFVDASNWTPVIQELQSRGLPVLAPANPLRSLAGDSAYIASVVNEIDGPVLLVGHSYGGAVITVAGAAADNVVGLVYITAFILDENESFTEVLSRFPETRSRMRSARTTTRSRATRLGSSSRSRPSCSSRPSPRTSRARSPASRPSHSGHSQPSSTSARRLQPGRRCHRGPWSALAT